MSLVGERIRRLVLELFLLLQILLQQMARLLCLFLWMMWVLVLLLRVVLRF
jgi:hypothetical protein